MSEGRALGNARKNKNDEYYTRIEDIELELKHYKNQFYNKVVLCNCDDPYESNFFKYFALNFNSLNLKKLICTCYDGSPIIGEQISFFNTPKNIEISKKAYKIELTKVDDFNNDGATDLSDIKEILKHRKLVRQLKGDGDFRSDECGKEREDWWNYKLPYRDEVVDEPDDEEKEEEDDDDDEPEESFVLV